MSGTNYAKLSWKVVAKVMVAHATNGPIEDALFSKFVSDLQSQDFKIYLATTTGSSELSSVQRKSASEALSNRNIPVFMITDSRLVRGIATAAAWLGVNIKSFSWEELDKALDLACTQFGIDPSGKKQILTTVSELKAANEMP